MRRHERGPRRSDAVVAVVSGPWHLLVGVVATAFTVLVPLLVGVSGAFAAALAIQAGTGAAADPGSPGALAVGGVLAVLMAWWGPGGAGLRRGTRSLVRGVAPGDTAAQLVTGLALVLAFGLVVWAVTHGSPTWWPRTDPPSIGGTSVG